MNEPCYYRVSVRGLCVDEQGRILLCQNPDTTWELFGGGLEHGEDPKDCLAREITEETGLTVTSMADQPSYFLTGPRPGYDTYMAHVIYSVEMADLDFTPTAECLDLQFYSLEEMGNINLFPPARAFYELLRKERSLPASNE